MADIETSTRTPRVLLADDDDAIRWALSAALQMDGYDVDAVADGSALLEHIATSMLRERDRVRPDVVVTDVRMPGSSVLHVLEELRHGGWATPVIVLSAYADENVRTRVRRLGASILLDKPVDWDRFEAALRIAAAAAPRSVFGDRPEEAPPFLGGSERDGSA